MLQGQPLVLPLLDGKQDTSVLAQYYPLELAKTKRHFLVGFDCIRGLREERELFY